MIFLFSTLLVACSNGKIETEIECTDGLDNDSDGLSDCDDSDCSASCTDSDMDTDTHTDTGTDSDIDSDFGPEYDIHGLWIDDNPTLNDGCGIEEGLGLPVEFFVHSVNEGGLQIEVSSEADGEELGPMLDCIWGTDFNYTCAEIEYIRAHISDFEPDTPSILDAEISYNVGHNGQFLESETLSGDLTVQIACDGSDCNSVSSDLGTTFPCSIERIFNASYVGSEQE